MHLSSSRTTVSARRGRPPVPMERGFVSGLLSRISHVPDRLLHSGRRRAALAVLAGGGGGPGAGGGEFHGDPVPRPLFGAGPPRAPPVCGLGRGLGGPARVAPARR